MARESKTEKLFIEFSLAMKEAAENFTENYDALMEIVRTNNRPENGEKIAQDFMYYLNEVYIGAQYIAQSQQEAEKNIHMCEKAAKILGGELKVPDNTRN